MERLINPTKPEIGKISKRILKIAISVVKAKGGYKQWRNTQDVIKWFQSIENKNRKSFINFDICAFYPSISSDILSAALDWAKNFVNISPENKKIIMKSKKSYLYLCNEAWVKKGDQNFDVVWACLGWS